MKSFKLHMCSFDSFLGDDVSPEESIENDVGVCWISELQNNTNVYVF